MALIDQINAIQNDVNVIATDVTALAVSADAPLPAEFILPATQTALTNLAASVAATKAQANTAVAGIPTGTKSALQTVAVTAITVAGGVATVTTAPQSPAFVSGNPVTLAGISATSLVGTFPITSVANNTTLTVATSETNNPTLTGATATA